MTRMNPPLQVELQKAATLLRQQRLPEAEAVCRRVIEAEPRAVDAINLLSLISKQSGDTVQAEELMRRCLELDRRRPDIHGNLGNLLAQTGRFEEAEKAYRAALRIDPAFRAARLGLARTLLALDRAAAAAAQADRLVNKEPRDAEAWHVLAQARRAEGRHAGAETAFRKALSLKPDYAAARHNFGALLASLSRSEEALEELDKAVAAGVRGAEIAHNRASALLALGELDAAERVLTDTLAEMPAAASLQTFLARIRYMRGKSDYVAGFQQALATAPEQIELRVAYSRNLRGAGDIEESMATIREGFGIAGRDPRLLAELSAALHEAGQYDEALHQAEQAVNADPANPEMNDLVIHALLALGRAADAMPLIEQARQRVPLNQLYIALEATAARLLGDPRYESLYDYARYVRQYKLPIPGGWSSLEDFHADLIPVLEARHKFSAPPLDQSLRAGTQTPRGLLGDPDPVIQAFLKALEGPIAEFRDAIGSEPRQPLTSRNTGKTALAGCWSVRLHREGYHVNHVHTEGWISSAYYVEVPPEVEDAEARSGWIKFGEPRFPVPGATAGKFVKPEPGALLLFPSYMWHGTMPIHGDEARMTIAFDVVPRPD